MNIPKSNACLTGNCPECGAMRAAGYYTLPKDLRAMQHDAWTWVLEGQKVTSYTTGPLPEIVFAAHRADCTRRNGVKP
jgi:hypothetical protein